MRTFFYSVNPQRLYDNVRITELSYNIPTASSYQYISVNFGRGSAPLHHKYFKCDGNEQSLSQCESHNETVQRPLNSSHVEILCKLGMYHDNIKQS